MIGDAETYALGTAQAAMHSAWLAREHAWTHKDILPDVIATTLTEAMHAVNNSNAKAKPRPFFLPSTRP